MASLICYSLGSVLFLVGSIIAMWQLWKGG